MSKPVDIFPNFQEVRLQMIQTTLSWIALILEELFLLHFLSRYSYQLKCQETAYLI